MDQDNTKLENAICQFMAAVSAEKSARHEMFLQSAKQPTKPYLFPPMHKLVKSYTVSASEFDAKLANLRSLASKMPTPYGDMFCYIAYRDLDDRMEIYQRFSEKLVKS